MGERGSVFLSFLWSAGSMTSMSQSLNDLCQIGLSLQ